MKETSHRYFYSLDFLRAIASISVVIAHYGGLGFLLGEESLLTHVFYLGRYGVHIFFVITGFVIPYSLASKKYETRFFWRYMLKRSVRIDPPYFVSILLILFVNLLIVGYSNQEFIFDWIQFFSHLFYVTPFVGKSFYDPVYWSLVIEFQFYIFIALTYGLIFNKSYSPIILMSFLLSSFMIKGYTVFHYSPLFIFGILINMILENEKKGKLIHIGMLLSTGLTCYLVHGIEVTLVTLITFLFILFVRVDKMPVIHTLANISYSLYLTHNIYRVLFFSNTVVAILNINSWETPKRLLYLFLILLVSILFSYIYYKLVERPFLQLSKQIKLKKKMAITI